MNTEHEWFVIFIRYRICLCFIYGCSFDEFLIPEYFWAVEWVLINQLTFYVSLRPVLILISVRLNGKVLNLNNGWNLHEFTYSTIICIFKNKNQGFFLMSAHEFASSWKMMIFRLRKWQRDLLENTETKNKNPPRISRTPYL